MEEICLDAMVEALGFGPSRYMEEGFGWIADSPAGWGIRKIYYNEDKGTVAVRTSDGGVYTSKCSADDCFDLYIGVALALAEKWFGSKSAFRRFVDSKARRSRKKGE